jgi:hypothetical protein
MNVAKMVKNMRFHDDKRKIFLRFMKKCKVSLRFGRFLLENVKKFYSHDCLCKEILRLLKNI